MSNSIGHNLIHHNLLALVVLEHQTTYRKFNLDGNTKLEVGNVNNKHFLLALKVKSMLDPYEDENDDIQDDDVSLGADFVQRDEHFESVSEVSHSQDNQYIAAPVAEL
ncbi:Meiosis-specific protein ASY1 [Camellia lanceoleosa]|nr:Meiosis-specific protein ASY1 [Camellia lanceoleosa]